MFKGWGKASLIFLSLCLVFFNYSIAHAVEHTWTVGGQQYSSQDIGYSSGGKFYTPTTGWRFSAFIDGNNLIFGWDDATTDGDSIANDTFTEYRIEYAYASDKVKKETLTDEFCRQSGSPPWQIFENNFKTETSERSASVVGTYRKPIKVVENGGNRLTQTAFFRLVGIDNGKPIPLSCLLHPIKPIRRTTDGRVRVVFRAYDAVTGIPVSAEVIKKTETGADEKLGDTGPDGLVKIYDPDKDFAGSSAFYAVTIKRADYKPANFPGIPFRQGGEYTARLERSNSAKDSTVETDTDDPLNRGGAPEPLNVDGTDPNQNKGGDECGKYIGFGVTTGFTFAPGSYIVCELFVLNGIVANFVSRLVKYVPV